MKKVFLVALMAMMSTAVLADYITPEDNVEIAKGTGIYARAPAAKTIKDFKITDDVIKLYKSGSHHNNQTQDLRGIIPKEIRTLKIDLNAN